MNIAVNTRLLLKDRLEGIGWFTFETLKRICLAHPEHTFYFLFDRPFAPEFIFAPNVKGVVVFPQARHPILYYWFFQWSIPACLKKIKADLFISTDGYMPLGLNIPVVDVIHDINFEHFNFDIPKKDQLFYRHFFPKYAKDATRVATVSEYTKNDLIKTYGLAADKIDVVFNGSNTLYQPVDESTARAYRQKHNQGNPYFLYIGSLHARKNIEGLLQSFDLFKKNHSSDIQLMIVGKPMWENKNFNQLFQSLQFKKDIIFKGRVETNELKELLNGALALTYIPWFEGFGIPVLEGMQSGIPVLTSNVTSLPEVGGEATLYTRPDHKEETAAQMARIAFDKELRSTLIAKGLEQSKKFSWDSSAHALWNCIEKAMQHGR